MLGCPTARSSQKIRQNGVWEARRLDPAGIIITPGRRGWLAVPRVPIWVFFLPKVEVGLKSRNNELSGQTGEVPTLGGM